MFYIKLFVIKYIYKTFGKTFGEIMTLGNITEDDEIEVHEGGDKSVPSVYKKESEGISFKKSLILATVLHPAFFGAVALTLLVLALLGIHLDMFKRPEPPQRDIEFVLVTKEAPPINKNTKYRADINSRAGGKHDPHRQVSEPTAVSPKTKAARPSPRPAPKQPAPQKPAKAAKPVQPKQPPQPQQPKQVTPTPPAPTPTPTPPQPKAPTEAPKAPVPATPRPTQTMPKPTVNPKSTMQIPFPSTKSYADIGPASGGPVTTSSGSTSGKSIASSSAGSSPSPSFSPSASGSGSSSSTRPSSGSSGNVGNPGPGNPSGVPGIDAIREPDFGPYMRELQRRIKMNWSPPKGNESKRVVLLFSISRDGRLLNVKVYKSSGIPTCDNAAIQAVQLTAPFKPLPPEYRGDSVDIQFTFDYNVFGASRY